MGGYEGTSVYRSMLFLPIVGNLEMNCKQLQQLLASRVSLSSALQYTIVQRRFINYFHILDLQITNDFTQGTLYRIIKLVYRRQSIQWDFLHRLVGCIEV